MSKSKKQNYLLTPGRGGNLLVVVQEHLLNNRLSKHLLSNNHHRQRHLAEELEEDKGDQEDREDQRDRELEAWEQEDTGEAKTGALI